MKKELGCMAHDYIYSNRTQCKEGVLFIFTLLTETLNRSIVVPFPETCEEEMSVYGKRIQFTIFFLVFYPKQAEL